MSQKNSPKTRQGDFGDISGEGAWEQRPQTLAGGILAEWESPPKNPIFESNTLAVQQFGSFLLPRPFCARPHWRPQIAKTYKFYLGENG